MSESINKVMIEELKELMEDDFSLLLETYLTDGDQRLVDLDNAIKDKNIKQIRELAHSLKGSSSNLGAETLAEISYKVETMGRETELAGIDDAVTQLKKEYKEVKKYFLSIL